MLSIVIPTLNAQNHLPALLAQVDGFADEVVVSDGGSRDETLYTALDAGARIAVGCKGRGWQLARGARWASLDKVDNDWLLFLHADAKMGEGWQKAVRAHMDVQPSKAGYFKFSVDDKGFRPRLMEFLVGLRCSFLRLPYGDQGLLISRALYEEVGGFPIWELFEDVAIVRALKRRRLRPLNAAILTNPERYKKDGYLRRSVKNLSLLLRFFMGASPESLSRSYTK